ncbi:hypothetical protein PVK06_026536 [Gossypium arboreum]|uniref:Uncharacterized protein n=1 Tax=Gossypium arboreum TaxID=29729 RepID=A0ABR0P0F2_GOSAR|nr:hypothetical protein PVK06_026536 [Gossypium arboreum]
MGAFGSRNVTFSGNYRFLLRTLELPFSIPLSLLSSLSLFPTIHLTSVAKKFSFQTGCFDSKNRRSNLTTKEQDEEHEPERIAKIEELNFAIGWWGSSDRGWKMQLNGK